MFLLFRIIFLSFVNTKHIINNIIFYNKIYKKEKLYDLIIIKIFSCINLFPKKCFLKKFKNCQTNTSEKLDLIIKYL